jgi:hypothetical protein
MEEADIGLLKNKVSKFKKFKNIFIKNSLVRLGFYLLSLLIVLVSPLSSFFYLLLYGLFYCTESYLYYKYTEIDFITTEEIREKGEIDEKIESFFKNLFKKKKKNNIIEEIKLVDNRETIEALNNRLKELNPNGSIVRDPMEIAREKAEYVGLLQLLEQYQAIENKEKTFNNTPVPTLEINNDQEKSYSYMKK